MANHPLDHVAFAAFEAGMDHCHIVGSEGEVVRDEDVDHEAAFAIVSGWEHVNLSFAMLSASEDHVSWLYVRLDASGEPMSEAVQFVSLRPDLVRASLDLH